MALRLAYILIPIFLALWGLGAFAVAEYQKHGLATSEAPATGAEPVAGAMDYMRERIAELRLMLPGAAGDILSQNADADVTLEAIDLADALPAAPQGWAQKRYSSAHGAAITGVLFETGEVAKDAEERIQDAFLAVQATPDAGGVASFVKGDQIVSVMITYEVPQALVSAGAEPWANIKGTQFQLLAQEASDDATEPRYRRFVGNVAAQFEILAFTNADDAAVTSVLDQIDFALLNEFADGTIQPDETPDAGPDEISITDQDDPPNTAAADVADAPSGAEPLSEAEVAALKLAAEALQGEGDAGSFFAKLGDLFAAKGGNAEAEPERPRRMVCTIQKGFKRCAFPKED